jgi:hypothetical protein
VREVARLELEVRVRVIETGLRWVGTERESRDAAIYEQVRQ